LDSRGKKIQVFDFKSKIGKDYYKTMIAKTNLILLGFLFMNSFAKKNGYKNNNKVNQGKKIKISYPK